MAAGGLVLEVSEKVLSAITRRDNPQMVVGVFKTKWRSLSDIRPSANETYIALDRVRDPGNLGTIIRTADAAGASGVILVGECTDPFSLETVRATMGSVFALPVTRATPEEFLAWKKGAGVSVVATHLAGAVDYRTVDYKKKPSSSSWATSSRDCRISSPRKPISSREFRRRVLPTRSTLQSPRP